MKRILMATAAGLTLAWASSALADDAPSQKPTTVSPVEVPGRRTDDTPPKLDHIMREVSGTQITVTKRTTVTKLDLQPTIADNNLQQLFSRSPGLLVTEQPTPAQFNLGYRGLGNPQESEYVTVLQDGQPLASDWIGFPTLYVMPLPQSVSEIQLIRGGSALLYGPEPAPAVNFVSRRPKPGAPFSGSSENVVGGHGLYSTYDVIEAADGPFEYRAGLGYVVSDGQRQNARSTRGQFDLYLGWRPAQGQLWSLDLRAWQVSAGDPGRLIEGQYLANPEFSPTPYNHDWVDRYSATVTHSREFGAGWLLEAKAWTSWQQLSSRAGAALSSSGVPPTSTTVQNDVFRTLGADVRFRKRWGRGNALTFGFTGYGSEAPFRQWTNSTTLTPGKDDHSGTPRLDQTRSSRYSAFFAENVFRFGRFHIVPSARMDTETVKVDETVRPPNLVRPLIHVNATRSIPLLGLGFGNDFGKGNETYFSVSQGWRPLRYFDVASPFSNQRDGFPGNPSRAVSWEAGVHGTPLPGLFYDVGVFQIDFQNRVETRRNFDPLDPTAVLVVNTGNTRHRGLEAEVSYDFFAGRSDGQHLTVFGSGSWLEAQFTGSLDPTQIGKTPAFAPRTLVKGGITWRKDKAWSVSLTGVSVASQYWQDSDLPGPVANPIPARIPAYTVFDLAGDWWITPRLRLIGGVSNLGDERYYSRIFSSGIEPGPRRTGYFGLAVGF